MVKPGKQRINNKAVNSCWQALQNRDNGRNRTSMQQVMPRMEMHVEALSSVAMIECLGRPYSPQHY